MTRPAVGRHRPPAGARPEAGTSLPEVLAVGSIFAVLGAALVAVLQTVSLFEAGRTARVDARIGLERAFDAIATDLQVGTPTAGRPTGGRPGDTLALLVTDRYADTTVVYWTVGDAGLERLEADPVTLRITARTVFDPAVRPAAVDPFGYFDAAGNRLDPDRTAADQLARCTTLVEVTLAVPEGDQPLSATERRAVRTRPPGAETC